MAAISLNDCTKVTLEDIEVIAADARGLISRVYAHWTAGHYGQGYDDYHILIDRDAKETLKNIVGSVLSKLRKTNEVSSI